MAQEKVLNETKKVLEITEESEEKIALVEQDLRQNENLCEQLEKHLKELRELNIIGTANLEDNKDMKATLKKYNLQFVTFAQKIYSCGQELFTELGARQAEMDRLDDMLNESENKRLEKLKEYEAEENRLKTELALLEEAEIKEKARKEQESRVLAAENVELKMELQKLNEEIGCYENYVKEQVVLREEEELYRKEIEDAEECIKVVEEEINAVQLSVENIEMEKKKCENEAEKCTLELDKKTQEIETEISVALQVLEENKLQSVQIFDRLREIERENKNKEADCARYKKELVDVELKIREREDIAKQRTDFYEKSTEQYESSLKEQTSLNEKLKGGLSVYKIKIDKLDEELEIVRIDIENLKVQCSKIDLKEDLEAKQNELKQLKIARQELKDKYNKKQLEIETETKKHQQEIDEIALKNKQLEDEIAAEESRLSQIRADEAQKTKEKQETNELLEELELHIKSLEAAKTKADKDKQTSASHEVMAPPEPSLGSSVPEKGVKRQRHWDSDSTIDEEHRRFAEMAKLSFQMRKSSKKESTSRKRK